MKNVQSKLERILEQVLSCLENSQVQAFTCHPLALEVQEWL
jgi:hypothetical protein